MKCVLQGLEFSNGKVSKVRFLAMARVEGDSVHFRLAASYADDLGWLIRGSSEGQFSVGVPASSAGEICAWLDEVSSRINAAWDGEI